MVRTSNWRYETALRRGQILTVQNGRSQDQDNKNGATEHSRALCCLIKAIAAVIYVAHVMQFKLIDDCFKKFKKAKFICATHRS